MKRYANGMAHVGKEEVEALFANNLIKGGDLQNAIVIVDKEISEEIAGKNPYVYPAVDWYNELFNDNVFNSRANINMSGGSETARYYARSRPSPAFSVGSLIALQAIIATACSFIARALTPARVIAPSIA